MMKLRQNQYDELLMYIVNETSDTHNLYTYAASHAFSLSHKCVYICICICVCFVIFINYRKYVPFLLFLSSLSNMFHYFRWIQKSLLFQISL